MTCPGFKAAGTHAGLKKNGEKDLGLIFSDVPAAAAGVFTTNRVKAAPVLLDMERIKSGTARAIIANSRNANCCTGARGMQDALAMGKAASAALGIDEKEVMVASTGVIGTPLPVGKIVTAAPGLAAALSSEGFMDCARAMMTTDTVPKLVHRRGEHAGKAFNVVGLAKGSGMIAPNMATMLCFVCTDIGADPGSLKTMLVTSVNNSLNTIIIDGDTSTNDTTLILANGLSGISLETPALKASFQRVLDDVLITLARALVKDGEGATKVVQIDVRGAVTSADARTVAETVANSPLVKTAVFGQDANWGRIAAAAGRAGIPLDPDRLDIFFNDVQIVSQGLSRGDRAEAAATTVLKLPEFSITIDLNGGPGEASVLTCDFSIDYVKINADYRS
ncbi:MAG: bifunctional glutamate N-acetyltransferase/amino-acid acetyltransferase ArgJ [Deltaproteobacteria bacterium]|nr:bifunctional glutamate N-acetyltransferase/amino-acid acetyltransferase ArgJ [Deltaproteobacteria bacterium]